MLVSCTRPVECESASMSVLLLTPSPPSPKSFPLARPGTAQSLHRKRVRSVAAPTMAPTLLTLAVAVHLLKNFFIVMTPFLFCSSCVLTGPLSLRETSASDPSQAPACQCLRAPLEPQRTSRSGFPSRVFLAYQGLHPWRHMPHETHISNFPR
jgi:hypothetical protein